MMTRIGVWINGNAAAIQAIAALFAASFTAIYVVLTFRYVKRTGEAIGLTQAQLGEQRKSLKLLREQVEQQGQSLKLAEKQFERDWEPQLRIWVHRANPQDVKIEFVNLGRTAIHVETIEIGAAIGTARSSERMNWLRLVPVNESHNLNIHAELLGAAGRLLHIDTALPLDANMAVRVEFFSAGRLHETEWFQFGVVIRERVIAAIKPMPESGPA
jgi:hypothetical protein